MENEVTFAIAPWIIPALFTLGQAAIGLFSQNRQNKANRDLAATQAGFNEQYLAQQLEYNTPGNQMSRFRQAGLNPNLVYSRGDAGTQSQPLSYPNIQATDMSLPGLAQVANQTAMTRSQVSATDAKTVQTQASTQLIKLQKEVLARNPALDDTAYKAIIQNLISSANIKASQEGIAETTSDWFRGNKDSLNTNTNGARKLQAELEFLEQRFRLGELDSKLKAQVMTSKEFQNAILEVQKKFMTDGDITPQHILQFIQLLLMKSL